MAGICAGIPRECLASVASGNLSTVEIGSKAIVIPNVQNCRANVFDLATECKRDPDVTGRIPGVHAFFKVKTDERLITGSPLVANTARASGGVQPARVIERRAAVPVRANRANRNKYPFWSGFGNENSNLVTILTILLWNVRTNRV